MIRAKSSPSMSRSDSSSRHRIRPWLEPLEDRLPLGDTVLGLSVVALAGLGSSEAPLIRGYAEVWQDGFFSLSDETRSGLTWPAQKASRTKRAVGEVINQNIEFPGGSQTNLDLPVLNLAITETPAARFALYETATILSPSHNQPSQLSVAVAGQWTPGLAWTETT